MKIKHAFTCRSMSPLSVFKVTYSSLLFSPWNCFTSLLFIISIFCFSFTFVIRMLSPLRVLLRLMSVTFLQISDKYRASSRALLPPPTIDTSSFLYRAPSHREQKLIPFPSSLSSLVFFNFLVLFLLQLLLFLLYILLY